MTNKKGGKTGAYKETQRKCFKKKGIGEQCPKLLISSEDRVCWPGHEEVILKCVLREEI